MFQIKNSNNLKKTYILQLVYNNVTINCNLKLFK